MVLRDEGSKQSVDHIVYCTQCLNARAEILSRGKVLDIYEMVLRDEGGVNNLLELSGDAVKYVTIEDTKKKGLLEALRIDY